MTSYQLQGNLYLPGETLSFQGKIIRGSHGLVNGVMTFLDPSNHLRDVHGCLESHGEDRLVLRHSDRDICTDTYLFARAAQETLGGEYQGILERHQAVDFYDLHGDYGFEFSLDELLKKEPRASITLVEMPSEVEY